MRMKVVQCWDDGVQNDIKLIDILKTHGAKATFNLNAGLHEPIRSNGWEYKGTLVERLALDELTDVYADMTIANHSLTHPHLPNISAEDARYEVVEGRKRLQDIFQAEIAGFAYPFGTHDLAVMNIIRDAGHCYARTCINVDHPMMCEDPMAFHSNCHFLANDFWDRYERAKEGGVFYFWGHSYEILNYKMWCAFDDQMERIASDSESEWAELCSLFDT